MRLLAHSVLRRYTYMHFGMFPWQRSERTRGLRKFGFGHLCQYASDRTDYYLMFFISISLYIYRYIYNIYIYIYRVYTYTHIYIYIHICLSLSLYIYIHICACDVVSYAVFLCVLIVFNSLCLAVLYAVYSLYSYDCVFMYLSSCSCFANTTCVCDPR